MTSQRLDLVHKAPLYAAAGVELYVVLDLPARRAVVHTGPGPEGYATVQDRGPADDVEVLGITVPLGELLRAR